MIELAVENRIELFCLPPHTTHKLQPLDIGVFGPLQKNWTRQCDEYLGRTGHGMQKRDVVSEYMKARERSFTANTIVHAWKKCGIEWDKDQQELKGLTVFTDADFAPSLNTSTRANVPPSYPQELPSDFDPWIEPEATGSDAQAAQPAPQDESDDYMAFQRTWDVGDGTGRADGGDDGDGDNGDNDGDDDDEGNDDEELTDEEGQESENDVAVDADERDTANRQDDGSLCHLPAS
jgi:hypothetical protein